MISEPADERTPVSRDAIVSAALALLAENGLDGVSFRRIAARLGVSGPTLYWHVDNKRQLMDLMAETLLADAGVVPSAPAGDVPWWEWLRANAVRMFQALIATRDAPRVLAGNRPSAENFTSLERSLEVLVGAGFSPGEAQQSLFAVGAYVLGSATEWQAEAERARTAPADAEEAAALRLETFATSPLLVAAFAEKGALPHTSTFEFGLDLLIDGLRARYPSS